LTQPEELITKQKIRSEMLERAKEISQEMTPAESILWSRLKANRLKGFHFRRQQIIEPFIVDFYCHATRLVVEVDGDVHAGREAADRERSDWLENQGLRVIRFTNREVLDEVVVEIVAVCREGNPAYGWDELQ